MAESAAFKKLNLKGQAEIALAFVTKQSEVDALARSSSERCAGDAVVWLAYPKQSSKRYGVEHTISALGRELAAAGMAQPAKPRSAKAPKARERAAPRSKRPGASSARRKP